MPDAVQPSSPEAGTPRDAPVLAPGVTVAGIGRLVGDILTRPAGRRWWAALAGSLGLVALALGLRLASAPEAGSPALARAHPLDSADSDWWLAIASGSLMLAALLHLVEAEWRCAVSRVPELVALVGVGVAILDPLLQPGRTSLFGELYALDGADLPARIRLALMSDSSDVVALLVVAATFLAVRLLPDLGALRGFDPARAGRRARFLALASRGWHGSVLQWQRWTAATRSIALLGILAVVASQTDAALRVAGGAGAGAAIVPILMLAGAILAGTGVTAALLAILRSACRLHDLITARHFDILARIILVLGLASLYCHLTRIGASLLHGDATAQEGLARHFTGAQVWASWGFLALAIVPSQLLWSDRVRRSSTAVALIGGLASFGVLAERVGLSLAAPGMEGAAPSGAAILTHLLTTLPGALGLFLALWLLAARMAPVLSIAETRRLVLARDPETVVAAPQPARPSPPGARPVAGVVAEFGTETALAAGIRALAQRHPRLTVKAYGPAPMPLATEALRVGDGFVRNAALTGALAGGLIQFALALFGAGGQPGLQAEGGALPGWPFLIGPSVCVAAMTGSLAAALALFAPIRLARLDRPDLTDPEDRGDSPPERFVLVADLRGQDVGAERVERILAALPAGNARPRTIGRVPA